MIPRTQRGETEKYFPEFYLIFCPSPSPSPATAETKARTGPDQQEEEQEGEGKEETPEVLVKI